MGALLSLCLNDSAKADKQRLESLHTGARFSRKRALGFTEKVMLRLSEDSTSLGWRVVAGSANGALLVRDMLSCKPTGAEGFVIEMRGGPTETFTADTAGGSGGKRDEWVVALVELIHRDGGEATGGTSSASRRSSTDNADDEQRKRSASESKRAYFSSRQSELDKRQKAAEARKAKYSGTGMKHTASAMLSRSGDSV